MAISCCWVQPFGQENSIGKVLGIPRWIRHERDLVTRRQAETETGAQLRKKRVNFCSFHAHGSTPNVLPLTGGNPHAKE
jgi:hypothetical protein